MTAISVASRVPSGDIDRVLAVGLDATVMPPRLVIATFRRPADALSERDFRPTAHVVTIELQYVPLLVERIQAAVASAGDWKDQDRMRGGYALQAAVDTVLALRNGDHGLELKVEKMRDDEDGEVIPLSLRRLGDSCLVDLASPGPKALTEQQRTVLRSLSQSATSEGLSTSEWQRCTTLAPSSFYAARKRLLEDELIVGIHGSRRFAVSPKGNDALQLQTHSRGLQNGAGTTPLHYPPSKGGGVGVPGVEESEEDRLERAAIEAEGVA